MLAIPALAGAGVYEGFKMLKDREPLSTPSASLMIGAAVSFVVGLATLRLLNRLDEPTGGADSHSPRTGTQHSH